MNKDDLKNCFENVHNGIRRLWYYLDLRISAYRKLDDIEPIIMSNYVHEQAVLDIIKSVLDNIDELDGHVEFIPDVWEVPND